MSFDSVRRYDVRISVLSPGCQVTEEYVDAVVVLASDYKNLKEDRDQQYAMKVKAREQRDAITFAFNKLQEDYNKLHAEWLKLTEEE